MLTQSEVAHLRRMIQEEIRREFDIREKMCKAAAEKERWLALYNLEQWDGPKWKTEREDYD